MTEPNTSQENKQSADEESQAVVKPETHNEPAKDSVKNTDLAKKATTDKARTTASTQRSTGNVVNNKLSKTAVLALILALTSAAGVGALYYLQSQKNAQLLTQLNAQNTENKQQVNQLLAEQSTYNAQQFSSALETIKQESQARIEQLSEQLNRLEQNQPTDWLLYEAEYLVRMASRTLWLEHDTTAAINLLTDADARIAELNDPQYLTIRQLLREDIEALKLMPKLDTEEVILSVLALSKQIPQLTFAMAKVPDSQEQQESLQLTENTGDWRENLAKTWRKFLADFITIRRRTGDVEPLMSPQHQRNLKENLALKLQQVQWAASKENAALYQQHIADLQQWLTDYFDMSQLETAKFYQATQLLKNKVISFDYPNKLVSLTAIRQRISAKSARPTQAQPTEQLIESSAPEDLPQQELAPEKSDTNQPPKTNDVQQAPASQPVTAEDA